jgi:CubicO group peptidase (beta-lactamase class C family)
VGSAAERARAVLAALDGAFEGDGIVAAALGELATHTSGLPREAPNHTADGPNPSLDFTAERAEEGVRAVTREPGNGRVYSNFGYRLLGLVLERATDRPYRDLLTERLLEPLAMTCSGVGAAGGGTRLTGHALGRPTGRPESGQAIGGLLNTSYRSAPLTARCAGRARRPECRRPPAAPFPAASAR